MKKELKDVTKNRLKDMATPEKTIRNFNTRLSSELIYRLKIHCVTKNVSIQSFVADAITEKLSK